MDRCVFTPGRCQVSLSEILGLQNQPVCEEQAWALCYQLCSLLEPNFSIFTGFLRTGPASVFKPTVSPVSLDEQFLMETEDQTVDYVGRLMYSCLDWGLGADVERELDETLELLVSQMTKVDIRLGADHCLQPICSITEVLQVGQFRTNFKSAHKTLFKHTLPLVIYLINQMLSLLLLLLLHQTGAPEFGWKDLMEELSRGVVLRPPKVKPGTSASLPVDTSPFSQLLQDIQLRRYTLRKVQVSRPRNLKPRVLNPKQETSLHELLMQEIRSADPVKLLNSCRRGQSYKGMMRLPFKWCVNLPLSFFKKIVLNSDSEQSQRNFWNERWSWDPSWVPLVLEACMSSSVSLHSLAMRDWHSQDVCSGCQDLLVEACDTAQSRCPITDPQEI
uniref:KIND domain-containing protein n=1 Tax=Astyanax mexicanus TaxID=7994 RepID=A0A8B9R7U1_ASTMX